MSWCAKVDKLYHVDVPIATRILIIDSIFALLVLFLFVLMYLVHNHNLCFVSFLYTVLVTTITSLYDFTK